MLTWLVQELTLSSAFIFQTFAKLIHAWSPFRIIWLYNLMGKSNLILPSRQLHVQVNSRNTRRRCEICSKLTIKTPERGRWYCSGVFIVNFVTYFTPFSSVSIVNFERVNAGRVSNSDLKWDVPFKWETQGLSYEFISGFHFHILNVLMLLILSSS